MDEKDIKEFHKELDMIQACINRMAQNSFQIKGWAVTVNLAFVALAQKIDSIYVCVIVLVSILVFWHLDAFFLQTETKYRKLFDEVREKRISNNVADRYNLDPRRYDSQVPDLCKMMISDTLIGFYGSFALLAFVFLIVMMIKSAG